MPALWVAGGTALLSGLMGSKSAKKAAQQQAAAQLQAAQIQAQAAERAMAYQTGATQTGLDVTRGQRQTGDLALAALMSGLGLGQYQVGPQTSGGGYTLGDGTMYGGGTTTTADGRIVGMGGEELRELPTYNLGGATQQQADAAASPYAGTFLEKFSYNDFTADPSYQFRTNEGRRNLEASLAARGNRLGGQALKDITNYGQEAASQEYQSAFQRFQTEKQRQLQQLQTALGIGTPAQDNAASSIQQTGGANANLTNLQGQYLGGGTANAGNAIAGGTIGATNALVGGIGQAGNAFLANQYRTDQMNMFNQAMQRPKVGGYGSSFDLLAGGTPRLGVGGP